MKAVCVNTDRSLEVREIATPATPAPGHLLVDIEAAAINHGDKAFLATALASASSAASTPRDVWGASGVGRVVAIGDGVPAAYAGQLVAIYRSLHPTPETIGTWCERAQVHHATCLILPQGVQPRDYSGTLVNVITAYAFLEQAAAEGHKAIVATAGNSATARALAALARERDVPVLHLVRSAATRDALAEAGARHILVTADADFERDFSALAEKLGATAIFDGLGGDMVARLASHVPLNTTFHFYGFLGGPVPIAVPTVLFMTKNLTMQRFSNFESATVKDPARLAAAFADLQGRIDDPLFHTSLGKTFRFDEIDAAMSFKDAGDGKAVLVA